MKKNLVLSAFLAVVLTSCYFVNDFFDPPKEREKSLQERCELAIKDYLGKTTKEHTYQPFGFGQITIHKPQEIADLELLEEQKKSDPSATLDTAIAQQKKFIEENSIERTVDLDHFFTLKDSTGMLKIFETNFILNDTLGVKSLSAKIMLNISARYEDALTYYFYEYNIFSLPSYYDSRTLSANFYAFFKQELEKRTGREEKSAFLLHCIKMTYEVKERGEFEQQEILQEMARQHIDEQPDISEYEILDFSPLYQMQQDDSSEVTGYYFFHKFLGTFQEIRDTNVVLVEFSKFYEITNVFQMERPFDAYFNQQ